MLLLLLLLLLSGVCSGDGRNADRRWLVQKSRGVNGGKLRFSPLRDWGGRLEPGKRV